MNTAAYKAACDRHADRMNKQGRLLEKQVSQTLVKLQERGLINGFQYHEPNSKADQEGKDFTIWKSMDGKEIKKSFGVTISMNQLSMHILMHPETPQFCFPIGINPTTIEQRILKLFD